MIFHVVPPAGECLERSPSSARGALFDRGRTRPMTTGTGSLRIRGMSFAVCDRKQELDEWPGYVARTLVKQTKNTCDKASLDE